MAEFKIYASIVLLSSLVAVGLIRFLKEKKSDIILISFLAGIITLAITIPFTKNQGLILIFQPWWFIRTMLVESSRLNWIDLELRRQTYLFENNLLRVVSIELSTLAIFLVGNLGLRLIGFFYFFRNGMRKLISDYTTQLFLLTVAIGFTFPLLFLQKGVAGNTSQSLQYSLLIMGILAGVTVGNWLTTTKNGVVRCLIAIAIFVLLVPTQLGLLYEFYSKPPVTKISHFELEALAYLKNNSDKKAVILTPPYDQFSKYKDTVSPEIWAWFDTSYISSFSYRRTYLSDIEQLDIMGYKTDERVEFQKKYFNSQETIDYYELAKRKINYVYFNREQSPKIDLEKTGLSKEFDNQKVQIWKVNDPPSSSL